MTEIATEPLCERCGLLAAKRGSTSCGPCVAAARRQQNRAGGGPAARRVCERGGGGGAAYGVSSGPVYAVDLPGSWWPSATAAGRALSRGRSSVDAREQFVDERPCGQGDRAHLGTHRPQPIGQRRRFQRGRWRLHWLHRRRPRSRGFGAIVNLPRLVEQALTIFTESPCQI